MYEVKLIELHNQVRYEDRNRGQAPTSIPKNAVLSDFLLPVGNVYYHYSDFFKGWIEKNLFPSYSKSREDLIAWASSYVGKKMKITMPIMIENIQNDYIFVFQVDKFNCIE